MSDTLKTRLVAAAVFVVFGALLANVAPSLEVGVVLHILLLTVFLFAFEVVSVDVAALSILVLLGLFGLIGPMIGLGDELVSPNKLFSGFSGNAVMSIIAVMIIGAGLDKTGIMTKVAAFIMRVGGQTEARLIPMISATVGTISSFMQNVGAAALFIPVVSRISGRTGIPMSRLLMPMGFCAILGGTMTMVGSSPLILLNDLIMTSNQVLPADQQMKTFGLFDVSPVGIALVATGIVYFVIFGRFVLPAVKSDGVQATDAKSYFEQTYGVGYEMFEMRVPTDSPFIGKGLDDIEQTYKARVVGVEKGDGMRFGANGVDRSIGLEAGNILAVLIDPNNIDNFVAEGKLERRDELEVFGEALVPSKAGIAEVVIPPGSKVIGKTARDLWLRRTKGLSLLAINRGGETIAREGGGVRDTQFQAGDTLIAHVTWADLHNLESDRDYVVVTTDYPHEELRPQKVRWALVFFAIAISLVLFSDLKLSVALMVGALGMVLAGVLKIEEAYQAVSWKTVFLLASLIPLGLAVESTGTAKWIADQTLAVVGDLPIWMIQAAVAVLATIFTLVMSNVGATVLLVPLAVNIAIGAGADPAMFALTVGLATSNSFLIPTHQVNALIMGPGGYRVPDYMKAGGIMTILFLVVLIFMLNTVF